MAPAPPPAAGRPALHLTAASGWVNDPLGLTRHAGRWHLFYQYLPGSLEWAPGCHWGHASSPDLLTWTEHPPALAPGDGDLGCWSGCLVATPDGGAVVHYTSVNEPDVELGVVREARPRGDDWLAWDKGPVVVTAPAEHDLVMFRDPTVLRDGARWRMLVGAGYADGRAAVLTWTSPDLAAWTFDGVLAERASRPGDDVWTGSGWECPQLVAVAGEHVLVVSVWDARTTCHVAAAVGHYAEGRFTPRRWTRLTYGTGHYAASAFTDDDGRPGLVFWIREVGDHAAGWAGALSVPYLLSVDGGRVRLAPHPSVRGGTGDGVLGLDWTPGATGELRLPAPDGGEVVRLHATPGAVHVSTEGESLALPRTHGPVGVLVDGAVLEVCTGSALAGLPLVAPVAAVAPPGAAVGPWPGTVPP